MEMLLLLLAVAFAGFSTSLADYEASSSNRGVCDRQAKCEIRNNLTCFDSPLSYTSTSLELVDDIDYLQSVEEKLEQWKLALSQVPRCWRMVQPLLCSLYRPPCVNGSVSLPSFSLCEKARDACRITALGGVQWPFFLRCEQDIFRKQCKARPTGITINRTTQCLPPLVSSNNRESWYPDIDECGFSCKQNPLLTEGEQKSMREFVLWSTIFSVICCALTLLTYILDWPSSRKYPTRLLIYLTVCLVVVCFGYLAQFVLGPDAILCNKDGTIRHGEPSAQQNLTCVTIFVACYYFLFAALAWFAIICRAFSETILSCKRNSEAYWESQAAYFHLVAWSVPFVLALSVMAFSEVEADSITGVCFVSQSSFVVQVIFVLLPTIVAFVCVFYYLSRLEYNLVRLKNLIMGIVKEESRSQLEDQRNPYQIDPSRTKDRISKNSRSQQIVEKVICHLGIFMFIIILHFVFALYCNIYELRHLNVWNESLREHFSCRTNVRLSQSELENHEIDTCDLKNKPSLAMLKIHISIFAGACFTLFFATLYSNTGDAWKRKFHEFVLQKQHESAEGSRTTWNKIIADAYAHVKNEEDTGDHEVGDSASQNLSSTWTNIAQPFRLGIPPMMVSRRYSSTSDVSRQTAQWSQTIARKRKTRRERDRYRAAEKTTSTGDLVYGVNTPLLQPASQVSKNFVVKKKLINPPFTHGMSGEARGNALNPFRVFSESISPNAILKLSFNLPTAQPPLPFLPQLFPLIDPYTGYPLAPYSPYFVPMMAPPPCSEFVPFPDLENIKSPLIPLRAHETGSEASFKMPLPSDTEYDTEAFRPQTAVPRDARQPKSGRLSAPSRKNGFFSS